MSFVVHTRRWIFAVGVVGCALPQLAFAQGAPGGTQPGGAGAGTTAGGSGGGAGGGGGAAPGGGGTVTVQPSFQYFPGVGVAPTPPGQNLGGGNAQFSSSKPIMGPNDRDNFDFKRGGDTSTAYGNQNGSFVLGGGTSGTVGNPGVHLVRRGDTLWAICDYYFRNPYQWPRIWSYNPQIQNPHWIYPGDQVKLRGASIAEVTPTTPGGPSGIIDRRKQVPAETVFLRNQGYIEDELNSWGEITGAREDKMFLTDFDEVYLRVASNRDVKVGQELAVYRPVKSVSGGQVVQIQGTVKVDQWNAKERIARARVTETLDVIERGARVGPIQRRFEVVPPTRNEKDVEAAVIASASQANIYGQNQVVYIDQGEEAGLRPGNRLFVVRKGDAWHKTQPTRSAAKRVALEDQSAASIEAVPRPRDDDSLPEEVLAELRIVSTRKQTSMALVTASRREIENGDIAFARKGY